LMSKSKRDKSEFQYDKTHRIGVDTGGTFTDFVFETDEGVRVFKISSTPDDPSRAIREGVERIAEMMNARLEQIEIVHGTTVGTNALLERRGARIGLITTKGFEDVLAIGRQARPQLYNLNVTRPAPLVPKSLRFGVRERVAATGEVLESLGEKELARVVKKLRRERVEAVAVCLLFSFVNPKHEERIARALETLNVPLSVSHKILPEYREYERTSTVTINAYLQPLMGAYLKRLNEIAPRRVQIMQSSGGITSARVAASEPVRTILSGPAGGVVGAIKTAQTTNIRDLITFDMGGTSTDVALIADGKTRTTNEATIAGLAVAVPVLDIHTVGAGGGSIARVDAGGSLRVGPESAGARPGPACYGRGGVRATVTDANLVLRRFGGTDLLGGAFKLDMRAAEEVLTKLSREMSAASRRRVTMREAALGVLRVVNANMERALRAVSVERGFDPRGFTLLSFGGAGGLHAVELARALRIPRVIVPPSPGALSALGVLRSDVVKDQSRTLMLTIDARVDAKTKRETRAQIERAFREMEQTGRIALKREGFKNSHQRHERSLAARYKGQSFELEIGWTNFDELAPIFHRAHTARYGYARNDAAIEIVSARVRSVGIVDENASLEFDNHANDAKLERIIKPHGEARVFFEAKRSARIALYERERLARGRLVAPCIVIEYSSTTLVPPRAAARIDAHENLIIKTVNSEK
jgi:N-methylhydantoinase A